MTLKICIIGESGVGKTSLINRFTKDKFSNKYRITVGADLFSHDMNVDGDNFSLQVYYNQIWDTAGQEKFQSIGSAFYRGSDACVLVYDVTSTQSLEKLENWKKEFINQGGIDNIDKFPFIVVGNKADRNDKTVNQEAVASFCENNGGMKYFETSAKEGSGILEAMEEVVRQAAKQKREEEEEIFIPGELNLGEELNNNNNRGGGNSDCGC